ncbi:MAG: glycosyltransferase [Candidatus Pacebacteria bacterium]|nr:glycosyltransferase [Candidatus Paceibacterota bacterium]
MKVLVVTGDKNFKPGHPRYDLQRSAVEEFACVYWGRGNMRPKVPEGHFDVVTSQDPFLRGIFTLRVARRKKAKFNVQVHADLNAQPFWKHVLAQIVLRHADSVRVVSQKSKEQVERMGLKVKITMLPVFVDTSAFAAISRKQHEGKNILWIGRFEEEKDPLFAMKVLQEVLKSIPDARLTMLGAGSMEESLKTAAQDLPVTFTGWQDPIQYLAEADVVLSTSPAESYGASVVEALAAGVQVVALDVGVAKEAGAIVELRNNLAKGVVHVLRNQVRGVLKIPALNEHEWVQRWKESLI